MKLKLRIEELYVDSFEADADAAGPCGTVRANGSDPQTCYPMQCASGSASCLGTCPPDETCGLSCGGTCVPAYCDEES